MVEKAKEDKYFTVQDFDGEIYYLLKMTPDIGVYVWRSDVEQWEYKQDMIDYIFGDEPGGRQISAADVDKVKKLETLW